MKTKLLHYTHIQIHISYTLYIQHIHICIPGNLNVFLKLCSSILFCQKHLVQNCSLRSVFTRFPCGNDFSGRRCIRRERRASGCDSWRRSSFLFALPLDAQKVDLGTSLQCTYVQMKAAHLYVLFHILSSVFFRVQSHHDGHYMCSFVTKLRPPVPPFEAFLDWLWTPEEFLGQSRDVAKQLFPFTKQQVHR